MDGSLYPGFETAGDGQVITMTIAPPDGQAFQVDVNSKDTIEKVKSRIFILKDIECGSMDFEINGQKYGDQEKVSTIGYNPSQ